MNILEASQYINKTKSLPPLEVEPFRGSEEFYVKAKNLLVKSVTSQRNLEILECHKAFFKAEPDLSVLVPEEEKEEFFYSLKNKMIISEVPARLVFFILKCSNEYPSMNLFAKCLNEKEESQFYAENYIAGDYSIYDVICNITYDSFEQIEEDRICVKNKDNFDIYIYETDMVAIIPPEIKDDLRTADIKNIKVTKEGLSVHDILLKRLGDKIGACRSLYDLSGII